MKQIHRNNATTSASPSRDASIQPPSVPSTISTDEAEQDANQPLGQGVRDEIGTESRHTMIREAAYRLYQKRGCIDGYAVDDWLEAEAGVDHLLQDRTTSAAAS